MRCITISTEVKGCPKSIAKMFSKELLHELMPPLAEVEITQFDGNHEHDELHSVISFLGSYQAWINIVEEYNETENEVSFIDVAREMPAPFTYWRHKHQIVKKDDTHSIFTDEITYDTGNKLIDIAIFPIIYSLMCFRRTIYVNCFNSNKSLH